MIKSDTKNIPFKELAKSSIDIINFTNEVTLKEVNKEEYKLDINDIIDILYKDFLTEIYIIDCDIERLIIHNNYENSNLRINNCNIGTLEIKKVKNLYVKNSKIDKVVSDEIYSAEINDSTMDINIKNVYKINSNCNIKVLISDLTKSLLAEGPFCIEVTNTPKCLYLDLIDLEYIEIDITSLKVISVKNGLEYLGIDNLLHIQSLIESEEYNEYIPKLNKYIHISDLGNYKVIIDEEKVKRLIYETNKNKSAMSS